MSRTYLGDSVYAEFNHDHVILTTNSGFGPTNTIYLERQVMEALLAYYANLKDSKNP